MKYFLSLIFFSCLNMLFGLYATIVNCHLLSGYCCPPQTGRAAFCTEWTICHLNQVTAKKSIGENTREYTLSARLCPTSNSRCATVHSCKLVQFPFCRQLLSSEFSAFFMKINSEMCHVTDYKFKLYFTQIIFSLYILFPFSK